MPHVDCGEREKETLRKMRAVENETYLYLYIYYIYYIDVYTSRNANGIL